ARPAFPGRGARFRRRRRAPAGRLRGRRGAEAPGRDAGPRGAVRHAVGARNAVMAYREERWPRNTFGVADLTLLGGGGAGGACEDQFKPRSGSGWLSMRIWNRT